MKQLAAKKSPSQYDFLFIGLGAANCLLILSLHENGLLLGKTIAIIEPSSKSTNDRTFCFWSTQEALLKLRLEKLVSCSWDYIEIGGVTKQNIKPLHYYHIKGIDLYTETKKILNLNEVIFYQSSLKDKPKVSYTSYAISIENSELRATKVFDSRPPSFLKLQKNQSHIYQSFYGWKIKTSKDVFDNSTIMMMDFNIPQNNSTQFIYVLPFEKNVALIELTRFGKNILSEEDANTILLDYINRLNLDFEITENEVGVIPMSSAKMDIDDFGENWINMGARADLLKCSTGYAFHAMAEDALVQMEAIKNNQMSNRESRKKRFLFYDRLLLKILERKPQYGKRIFEILFKKVPTNTVLSFLREKTSLSEEIAIFSKLPRKLFIGAAIKDLVQQSTILPVLTLPFVFTVFSLILSFYNLELISWVVLAFGFLSVGLGHGALDHLTSKKIINKKQLFYFSIRYLLKSVLFGLVWWLSSDIALFLFIVYSAWHFGQADFKEWNLKQGWQSFLWGLVVLMTLLFFHTDELVSILKQIPHLSYGNALKKMSGELVGLVQILVISCGLYLAVTKKSKYMLFTLVYLLLANKLPLLLSFGIYFVGQHSINGWRHLSSGLNERSSKMWIQSLPFSVGGAFLIFYFLFFAGTNYIGIFFIILSCLSLPHVFSIHRFYSTQK